VSVRFSVPSSVFTVALTTDPDIFSCEQVINDHSSPEIKVKVIGQCQRSKQKCVCYTNVYTAAFYDYWLIDGRSSSYRLWRHQLQASGEVNGVAAAAESRARSVWPRSSTEGSSLVARLTVADGQQTESLELTGKWWRRRETDPRHLTLLFDPTTGNRSPTRSLIWSNHDAATSPIRRKARRAGRQFITGFIVPERELGAVCTCMRLAVRLLGLSAALIRLFHNVSHDDSSRDAV